MAARFLLDRLIRLAGAVFLLLTAVYCLVTYIPFTYEQMIKPQLIGWVVEFAEIHAWAYAAVTIALTVALRDALVRPGVRWLARSFVGTQLALAAYLLVHPLLTSLENDTASFVWSLVFLLQLVGLGVVDVASCRGRIRFGATEEGRDWSIFLAGLATGLFVSLLYFGIGIVRAQGTEALTGSRGAEVLALAWSLLSHLLPFLALAAAFVVVTALARLTKVPARTELALSCLLATTIVFLGVRDIVLAGVSLNGPLAVLYAALFAVAVVTTLLGVALEVSAQRGAPIEDGLAALLSPITLRPSSPLVAQIAVLALLGGAAWVIATQVAVYDWNYLVQKLSAGVVWCLAFALFYSAARNHDARPGWTAGILSVAVCALVAFRGLQAHPSRVPALLGGVPGDVVPALERHSGYDASFKLLYDALAPRVADASAGNAFYRFLQANTNISRATKVDPVDIDLVDDLRPTNAPKPNVFVFVVDSLRRDYLGAYDPKVTFTPAIDAFARDSIVMENAFTRYGATGLSEPSIWTGGLLLHKQYIEPFYPMNALQKLLDTEGYRIYLSRDTILATIVEPSPSIVELDEKVLNMDYDLCHSLDDLEAKLDARSDPSRPVFVYTQPQNLHVAQITRQGSTVPENETFPGFHAPYAARLKRLDRCFGEFVAALEADGLYADSIVILTSDHGESLGEEGRWGHAYTMYPEIVRIPLIVHLPPAMRADLTWDAGEVAFLTDIAPTLYYLLGHRPVRREAIFGRPLFVARDDDAARAGSRDDHLLASSYGPVYAILSDGGRSLYVADGVNYKDYLFDLDPRGGATSRTVTAEIKREREGQIREQIGEINRFYRFGDAEPVAAPAS